MPLVLGPLVLGKRVERLAIGFVAPQPRRHVVLRHGLAPRRNAGLAEIFLRQNVDRHLRPGRRSLNVVALEYHRSVGVANFADGRAKRDAVIRRIAVFGKVT